MTGVRPEKKSRRQPQIFVPLFVMILPPGLGFPFTNRPTVILPGHLIADASLLIYSHKNGCTDRRRFTLLGLYKEK